MLLVEKYKKKLKRKIPSSSSSFNNNRIYLLRLRHTTPCVVVVLMNILLFPSPKEFEEFLTLCDVHTLESCCKLR